MQAANSPSQVSWYIQDNSSDDEDHISDHSSNLRGSTFDLDESALNILDLTGGSAKTYGQASTSPSRTTQILSGPSAAYQEHHQTQPESTFYMDLSTADSLDRIEASAEGFDQAPSSLSRRIQSLKGPSAGNLHPQSLTSNSQAEFVKTKTDTLDTMEVSTKSLAQAPPSSSHSAQSLEGSSVNTEEHSLSLNSNDQADRVFNLGEATTNTLGTMEVSADVLIQAPSSLSRTAQSLEGLSTNAEEHPLSVTSGIQAESGFDLNYPTTDTTDTTGTNEASMKVLDQAPSSSLHTAQSPNGPSAHDKEHPKSLTPDNESEAVIEVDDFTTDTLETTEASTKISGQALSSPLRSTPNLQMSSPDNEEHQQSLARSSQPESVFEISSHAPFSPLRTMQSPPKPSLDSEEYHQSLSTSNQPEAIFEISSQAPASPSRAMQSSLRPSPDNEEHHQSPIFGKSEAMATGQLSDDDIDRTIYEILQTPITVTSASFKGPDGWPLRVEVEINAYMEGECSTRDVRTECLPRSLDVTSVVEAKQRAMTEQGVMMEQGAMTEQGAVTEQEAVVKQEAIIEQEDVVGQEDFVKQEDLDEGSCSTPRLEDIEAEIGLPIRESSLHYDGSRMSILSSLRDSGGPLLILANPSSGGRQAQVTHAADTRSMIASVHQVESPLPPTSLQPPDKPLPPLPNPNFQEKSYLSEPRARRRSLLSRLNDVQQDTGHSASRSITDLRIHPGLSRSKTWVKELVSPRQPPATTFFPGDESNIHPALRTQTLVRQTSSDTLGPLPVSLQTPTYRHRRSRSQASSPSLSSPSQPRSNPPSVYPHSPPPSNTFVDATRRSDDSPPRTITIDGRTEARPLRESSSDYARAVEDYSDLYRIGTGRSSDELLGGGAASPDPRDVRAAGRGALQRLGGERMFPLKRTHSLLMRDTTREPENVPLLPAGVLTARALEERALEARLAAQFAAAAQLAAQSAADEPPLPLPRNVTFAEAAAPTSSSSVYSADAAREKLRKEEDARAVDRQHVGLVRDLLRGRTVGASLRRRGRRVGEEVREFLGVGREGRK